MKTSHNTRSLVDILTPDLPSTSHVCYALIRHIPSALVSGSFFVHCVLEIGIVVQLLHKSSLILFPPFHFASFICYSPVSVLNLQQSHRNA
jgi:hypothetical protein